MRSATSPQPTSWGGFALSYGDLFILPVNQSKLGNINTGIMTNLSVWEIKDVPAVLVGHLGSRYSRKRTRGFH